MGPVSYGDSPYQSFSTFAGNPLYVSLQELIHQDLLTKEECEAAELETENGRVDYGRQFYRRYPLLKQAFSRSGCRTDQRFQQFCREEAGWIEDYALFMALKEKNDWVSWVNWDDAERLRDEACMRRMREELDDDVVCYEWIQYQFFGQWEKLRSYANEAGVQIVGDIPIYVAMDSADVWTHPELFQLDGDRRPKAVAGCPPDGFSPDGQLWGNPLYDWDRMEKDGFSWWMDRIRSCSRLYDVMRIDHFRGFDEYYAIPFGEKTARNGKWVKGPGMKLFEHVREEVPDLDIIAEDLGFITDSVRKLVADTGYPNMKVLQFAFNSDNWNEYLPFRYGHNCVVYTGTHDNETLVEHLENAGGYEKSRIRAYLNLPEGSNDVLREGLIRLAQASVADTCIIPIQDYLGTGKDGRINYPSTLSDRNWSWRMKADALTDELSDAILKLTQTYGRTDG